MAAKFDPKAKAKKQKIVAAVLGVVLLGVLAWQVPSLMKTLNKKPPSSTVATPPPPAAGSPLPGSPVTPAATPPPSSTLIDSDPAAQAAGGQLVGFDRFSSKDPFAQQLGTPTAAPAAPSKPAQPSPQPSGTRAPAVKPPASTPTSAKISVNGAAEQVRVGDKFPADDPLFLLVSLTSTTAKIAISEGSLDSGGATVTLKKGKKLTLQNTVDGARYDLVLVSTA